MGKKEIVGSITPEGRSAREPGQVRVVSQFNDYQRLVILTAHLLRKRGFRPHEATMQRMLEVVTTLPKAMRLLEAQNWDGYFPEQQQRLLLGRVQAQMTFMESAVLWTGSSVLIEAGCEHGNQHFCQQCREEGRVRLDGTPY